jgi:hypothetical protein
MCFNTIIPKIYSPDFKGRLRNRVVYARGNFTR